MTKLQALKARVEATLLLIKQSEEQDDRGLQFIRHYSTESDPTGQTGLRLQCLPREYLLLLLRSVTAAVEKQTGYLFA